VAVNDQTLTRFPLFAALGDDARREIASHFQERTFSPAQAIALEGEQCRVACFVVRGIVRVYRLSHEGREQVLAHLGPGGMFNLVPVLDGGSGMASVDALTEVTLYSIPCDRFRQVVRGHRAVALAVTEYLSAEVRRLSDMVEGLALYTVHARLARFLLSQSDDPQQSSHRWTQAEIAAHIGTVREMVGRTLRDLDAAGLIRRQRGRIVIANREELERQARGE